MQPLWRDMARTLPYELLDQLRRAKPTTEEAKAYLEYMLTQAFPMANEVAEAMKITRVVKDVTWATLKDSEFVEWLKKVFPLRKDLQRPIELYKSTKSVEGAKQERDTAVLDRGLGMSRR